MNQDKTSLWQKLSFSDITPLMKKLSIRSAQKKDLNSIQFVNSTLASKDSYPEFTKAIHFLRLSPFRSLLKFEKKQFIFMFFIHISDVIASLISALAAIQLSVYSIRTRVQMKLCNLRSC